MTTKIFTSDSYSDKHISPSSSSATPIETPEHYSETSLFDQFLVLNQRSFWQMKRKLFNTGLLIVIPFLFLFLTLIFWWVWAALDGAEFQSISYSPTLYTTSNIQLQFSCYYNTNLTGFPPIEGLPECTLLEINNATISCQGDESSLPVKGLCYRINFGEAYNSEFIATYGSFVPVLFWLRSIGPQLFIIPSMDQMIVLQWLTRKSIMPSIIENEAILQRLALVRSIAISCNGNIYFVGNNSSDLISYIHSQSLLFKYVLGETFETINEAQSAIKRNVYNWAIIEIKSLTKESFDVTIHVNGSSLPSLKQKIDLSYGGQYQQGRSDIYMISGFLTLQHLIEEYYVKYVSDSVYNRSFINNTISDNETYQNRQFEHLFANMGYPGYHIEQLLITTVDILPFIYVLAFLYPCSQLTKTIVEEKELRLREAMEIMGVRTSSLYICWFINFIILNSLLSIIQCVIVKISYITISSIFILFLLFFLMTISCACLAGMLASIFSKSRIASLITPLVFFIFAVPLFTVHEPNALVTTIFSLLSPTAFAAAVKCFLYHEVRGGFVNNSWHDILDIPEMYIPVIFLIVDSVIYVIIMLYLDAVMPKDWGTAKNPFFFILEPYHALFKHQERVKETQVDGRVESGLFEEEDEYTYTYNTRESIFYAVKIQGLRKEFKRHGKKFVAVNNLFWQMRDKEISVLLGHNGAGKSTAMNMMTGMLEADAGDCYIYGKSVRRELSKVRQMIGFCPQHNILWPELTCREHLEYFGKIKGLRGKDLKNSVYKLLCETGLHDKIDAPSHSLSGGQKRKLSIAIAFVGRSPLVFLDEPTAGLDVEARRYIWELLKRMSESHTIFLTTHYMDEADLLGHRIGIMSQGRLSCNGTSLFLKSMLGKGYSLSISLAPNIGEENVERVIFKTIPDAEKIGSHGEEALYRLPKSATSAFPTLLNSFDKDKESLGLRGYSLSATTLEDVFLRIVEGNKYNTIQEKLEIMTSREYFLQQESERQKELIWSSYMYSQGWNRNKSQFQSMITKRMWNSIRDRRMICFQIIMPVICVLIAMLLSLINVNDKFVFLADWSVYPIRPVIDMAGCSEMLGENSEFNGFRVNHLPFINALNLSWYGVDTFHFQQYERVGGIHCNDSKAVELTNNSQTIVHLTNLSAPHQSPISLHSFYSQYVKTTTKSVNHMQLSIGVFPNKNVEINFQSLIYNILIGAIITIPFTLLPSNVVAWIVKERECKARHIQKISGLHFYIYWLSNLVFDITVYLITMFLILVILACFQREEYTSLITVGPTIVLFLMYGFANVGTAYILHFFFKEHSSAQNIVMVCSFVTGFILLIMVFVFSALQSTADTSRLLKFFFRVIPSYSIGEGIVNLLLSKFFHAGNVSPWEMDIIGWPCIYMAIEFVLFMFATLIIDHPNCRLSSNFLCYKRKALNEREILYNKDGKEWDSDVEEEQKYIIKLQNEGVNHDMVRVVQLTKIYGNGKVAVKDITFGVMAGEVFGFLGTNGAGKTTTISILCQEFMPSSGCAYICGYDVVKDSVEALQCIGYCPQFDATLDLLTVEEHLYLYAGIRGIVSFQRADVVSGLIKMCDLDEYKDTLASKLSGGNKRKLSVAMSLVGGPRVVFLDEPSAGMDPVARRKLWTAIETVAQKCSVVLTTHHLEEVEALAHRVAIMVDGTLRCIGNKTHLKNKFGAGLELHIRTEDIFMSNALERWVKLTFTDAKVIEKHDTTIVFALSSKIPIKNIFTSLEVVKDEFGITDYSVSQTSIEQVFLKMSGVFDDKENHYDPTAIKSFYM